MTSPTPNAVLLDNLKSPRSATSQIYSPSVRPVQLSEESDDPLHDLELSEGPLLMENTRPFCGRLYSVSGFDFQHDIPPLSASMSEPQDVHLEATEKCLGLVNSELRCITCVVREVLRRRDMHRDRPDCGFTDQFWDIVSDHRVCYVECYNRRKCSSSLGIVVANMHSMGTSLLVWILVGVLV